METTLEQTPKDELPFSLDFQKRILARLIRDKEFLLRVSEHLSSRVFQNAYMQIICAIGINYAMKYRELPDTTTVITVIQQYMEKDPHLELEQFNHLLQEVYNMPLDTSNFDIDTVVDFVKKTQIPKALKYASELVKQGKEEEAQAVIKRAFTINQSRVVGQSFHHHNLHQRIYDLSLPRKCVPTVVVGELDKATDGGVGAAELLIVMAPTGKGKTLFLVNFARGAIMKGLKILYVTLEVSHTIIGNRLDSSISQMSRYQGRMEPNKMLQKVDQFYKAFGGEVLVVEYFANEATVATIEHFVYDAQIKHKFSPDFIIVDYADLLRPRSVTNRDKRHDLSEIYTDLRNLGKTFNVPVATASQTNRSGLNADVVDLNHISEDYGKAMIADIVIGLSQTAKEKETNKMRLFLAKNRNNPSGFSIPCFVDPATMLVGPDRTQMVE